MSHSANSRSFSRRIGRGFWRRKCSSPVTPAIEGLASADATGSGEDFPSVVPFTQGSGDSREQRGAHEIANDRTELSPSPRHSAGGGVCCVMLAAQVNADRWATLAVIAIFICGFAVAAVRANRPQRPNAPPRGHSAARPRRSGAE